MSTDSEILEKAGVLEYGHFQLSTKSPDGEEMHSPVFFNMKMATIDQLTQWLAPSAEELLNLRFPQSDGTYGKIEAIIGVANGGWGPTVALSHIMRAYNRQVVCGLAEKGGSGFSITNELRRKIEGKYVALVDDVSTSGRSLNEAMQAIENAGGIAKVILVVVNRKTTTFWKLPFIARFTISSVAYSESKCPLCQEGTYPLIRR